MNHAALHDIADRLERLAPSHRDPFAVRHCEAFMSTSKPDTDRPFRGRRLSWEQFYAERPDLRPANDNHDAILMPDNRKEVHYPRLDVPGFPRSSRR
ncbi:hypothetical protein J2046_006783 [Rhizobium petrolearium]|nr:hypothetical protein [Neorhizobium petrolearium]